MTLLTLLVMAGGLALAAQPEDRPLAADFQVKTGTTVHVRGTDLTIGLVRVTDDSRCPVEVRCITAGDANVVFSVRNGRAAATDVTLHLGAAPREVTRGRWRLRLVDLAPAQSLKHPATQKDYVATVRVDAVE